MQNFDLQQDLDEVQTQLQNELTARGGLEERASRAEQKNRAKRPRRSESVENVSPGRRSQRTKELAKSIQKAVGEEASFETVDMLVTKARRDAGWPTPDKGEGQKIARIEPLTVFSIFFSIYFSIL